MKTATYTGPSVRVAFSGGKYKLRQGQRVLVVQVTGDTATVSYDPSDQPLNLFYGTNAKIMGVPMSDLAPVVQPLEIVQRLEELRAEIRAERISWGELSELQGLAEYIDPSDVELLEWAGVPEGSTR